MDWIISPSCVSRSLSIYSFMVSSSSFGLPIGFTILDSSSFYFFSFSYYSAAEGYCTFGASAYVFGLIVSGFCSCFGSVVLWPQLNKEMKDFPRARSDSRKLKSSCSPCWILSQSCGRWLRVDIRSFCDWVGTVPLWVPLSFPWSTSKASS